MFLCKLNKPFVCWKLHQICYFFQLFSTKNAENEDFNQCFGCATSKCWSKYITLCPKPFIIFGAILKKVLLFFPQISHIVQVHRALKYIAPKDVYQKLESMRTPNYRREEENRGYVSKRRPRSTEDDKRKPVLNFLLRSTEDDKRKTVLKLLPRYRSSNTFKCKFCPTTGLG